MRSLKLVLHMTTVLVLCFPLISSADQTDDRLDGLFQTLQTSQDAEVLLEAEAAIWEIWYESGEEAIDNLMLEAAQLVRAGDLAAAESVYTMVIEEVPDFSEGWNRRATVRFYQRDYDGSLEDTEQTLKLEPRHFGAFWGLGMILGSKQDFERAIIAFERLLEIKPNSDDARPRIELLKQELAKQAV
ncbi:MAG: tetratricopeptide repeat protein [Gammaproteobacteria bacterium]|nr:tetratricopeptide repeat protein [Gammaproteobacteria bacterium]